MNRRSGLLRLSAFFLSFPLVFAEGFSNLKNTPLKARYISIPWLDAVVLDGCKSEDAEFRVDLVDQSHNVHQVGSRAGCAELNLVPIGPMTVCTIVNGLILQSVGALMQGFDVLKRLKLLGFAGVKIGSQMVVVKTAKFVGMGSRERIRACRSADQYHGADKCAHHRFVPYSRKSSVRWLKLGRIANGSCVPCPEHPPNPESHQANEVSDG